MRDTCISVKLIKMQQTALLNKSFWKSLLFTIMETSGDLSLTNNYLKKASLIKKPISQPSTHTTAWSSEIQSQMAVVTSWFASCLPIYTWLKINDNPGDCKSLKLALRKLEETSRWVTSALPQWLLLSGKSWSMRDLSAVLSPQKCTFYEVIGKWRQK